MWKKHKTNSYGKFLWWGLQDHRGSVIFVNPQIAEVRQKEKNLDKRNMFNPYFGKK